MSSANVLFVFFACPKKKNQKKGQANPIAPRVLPGLPTTVRTIYSLMYYDYSFSLIVFTLLHIAKV